MRSKAGQIFDRSEVAKDVKRLTAALRDRGREAEVEPSTSIDEKKKKTIDVTFEVGR